VSRVVGSGPVAVVVAALLAVSLLTAAMVGLATHENEETTDGYKTYTGEGEIPTPGSTYSAELYMAPKYADHAGPVPEILEFHVDYVMFYDARDAGDCSEETVRVAGLDRGNNRSGTATDEDLLPSLWELGFYETTAEDDPGQVADNGYDYRQVVYVQLAPEDSFSSEPVYINENGVQDEGILAVEECIVMPNRDGWYRNWLFVNGTVEKIHGEQDSVTVDNRTYRKGDYIEGWEPSRWYPICECEDMSEVEATIGPPPGESIEGPNGERLTPTPSGDSPTATPGAGTATVTSSPTATPPPTTATPPPTTPTATATDTSTPRTEMTPTPTARPPATDPPTPGDGPGFGVFSGMLAVALGAVLATRARSARR